MRAAMGTVAQFKMASPPGAQLESNRSRWALRKMQSTTCVALPRRSAAPLGVVRLQRSAVGSASTMLPWYALIVLDVSMSRWIDIMAAVQLRFGTAADLFQV